MNRNPGSYAVHLLAAAVVLAGFTACNHAAKPDSASTGEVPLGAPVEAPPPPEPASPLGSASGTLRMVDFAKQTDFWAYDTDPSDANHAKAQDQVTDEFHSAIAQWKPGSQSLVIFLFTDSLSADEAAQLKTSIVSNGEAIRKRSAAPGQEASISVKFASNPPATGNQTASVIISTRGSNGRSFSAAGKADIEVSSLPVKETWAKPGRLLPEITLRTTGKQHYGGSTFGGSAWLIETRVPVILTSGY